MNTFSSSPSRRRAFTLVEMLVALAVLSILLAVVFVPLRLALNSFHVGQARTATQNAAQVTLDQMERDFSRAVYVFPNTSIPGITDKAPYSNNRYPGAAPTDPGFPYTKSLDQSDTATPAVRGICDRIATAPNPTQFYQNSVASGDTSRVDMILARRNPINGTVQLPVQSGDTIVTYYARRQNPAADYDPVDNPVVLFRAEFVYRGSGFPGGNAPDTSPNRYGSCTAGNSNTATRWMARNLYGEADLSPLCDPSINDTAGNSVGSHTVAIPRGVGLVASQAFKLDKTLSPAPTLNSTDAPLQPDTSFQLLDTKGDGKIHQVVVNLALQTFDTNQGASTNANRQPTGQVERRSRTFDLPNVR